MPSNKKSAKAAAMAAPAINKKSTRKSSALPAFAEAFEEPAAAKRGGGKATAVVEKTRRRVAEPSRGTGRGETSAAAVERLLESARKAASRPLADDGNESESED